MPYFRLVYNLLAVILLLPPLALVYLWHGDWLWAWQGAWLVLTEGLAILALLGFVYSLRYYDSQEFLGLRHWQEGRLEAGEQELLVISPMHRFVRHPWYSLGLLLLWTQPMDAALLLSAVWISLYLVIGIYWEESRLIAAHGEIYRRYQQAVPPLLPRPWRYMTRLEAVSLLAEKTKGW
jgi:protein-S-isoprenylcysteine O-methyltransferase Ste14